MKKINKKSKFKKRKVKKPKIDKNKIAELNKEANTDTFVSGLSRLQRYPNYFNGLPKHLLPSVITKYLAMSHSQLMKEAKEEHITTLELTVIGAVAKSLGKGNDSMQATKYLHDRIAGAITESLEISGGVTPVQVETTNKPDLSKLSKEELKAYQETLLKMQEFYKSKK